MTLEVDLVQCLSTAATALVLSSLVVLCAGKKKTPNDDKARKAKGSVENSNSSNIRAPEQQDAIAAANDPNYATLANVYDTFEDPKIRPPEEQNAVANYNDPNYATLNNVNDVFVK
ncbi:hypothetical protein AAVH_06111 [Aphelenchoides avenae]|nr:hypothetical protein AAVH_06111 [Aphelenchus avenae]